MATPTKKNDPARYGKVDWKSLVKLDPSSPTGITWLVTLPRQRIIAGTPAGKFRTRMKGGKLVKDYPSLVFTSPTAGQYTYAIANIIRVLKKHALATGNDTTEFRPGITEWITANTSNIWWTIHKQLHTQANMNRLYAARLLTSKRKEIDQDFLQDVFSSACIKFNRNFDSSRAKETTFMFICVRTAIDDHITRTISRVRKFSIVGGLDADSEEGTYNIFTDLPSRIDHIAEYDRAESNSVNRKKMDAYAERSFPKIKNGAQSKYKEVYNLVLEGKNQYEIAKELRISRQRVHQIRTAITRRLKSWGPLALSLP